MYIQIEREKDEIRRQSLHIKIYDHFPFNTDKPYSPKVKKQYMLNYGFEKFGFLRVATAFWQVLPKISVNKIF